MVIILTWDNKYDVDVVRTDGVNPKVFATRSEAAAWVGDNDINLCTYFRITDLNE